MSTVAEIEVALAKLTDSELAQIERALHDQYRQRGGGIIYDDAYGIWTEDDQVSAAAEAFILMDREETRDEQNKPR